MFHEIQTLDISQFASVLAESEVQIKTTPGGGRIYQMKTGPLSGRTVITYGGEEYLVIA